MSRSKVIKSFTTVAVLLLGALGVAGFLSSRGHVREVRAGTHYVGLLHGNTISLFIGPGETGTSVRFHSHAGAGEAWLDIPPDRATPWTSEIAGWNRPEASPVHGWLTLRKNSRTGDWEGFWAAAQDGEPESLHLRRVAEAVAFTKSSSMFTGRGMHRKIFEGHRIHFTNAPEIVASQRAMDRATAAEFVTLDWEHVKFQVQEWLPPQQYECFHRRDLIFYQTNAVSLRELLYQHTGGAHGNSYLVGRNWYRANGGWQEFELGELFMAGADWQTRLGVLVKAGLVRQGASQFVSVNDGTVSDEPLVMTGNEAFTLNEEGLTIHYSPYEMGCYAEGSFALFVPFHELRGYLQPKGPLKCFWTGLSPAP